VSVPSWRDGDVQREADLIEEVVRVHGLDRLPTTLPARRRAVGRLTGAQRLRRRLEDALRDRGLLEVVAYSFTSETTLARLGLGAEPVLRLANPLSEEQSTMRPLLLPGLLDAARWNAAHGRSGLALFESAHVYRPRESSPPGDGGGPPPALERHHLAGLLCGALPASWRRGDARADYYAARALIEGLLQGTGVEWRAEPTAERPYLHPGRAAAIDAGGGEIGWIGELHPEVGEAWDVDGGAAFELDADALWELIPTGPTGYRQIAPFPAVLQDIAVAVDEEVPAAAVEAAVASGGGDLLRSARVFDVYRGEQVGTGRKSLALRLEFRAADRTLTDEEVTAVRGRIEAELERVGGKLRA
jgi:phenylalanyl-tRNA synthetase beta chain